MPYIVTRGPSSDMLRRIDGPLELHACELDGIIYRPVARLYDVSNSEATRMVNYLNYAEADGADG